MRLHDLQRDFSRILRGNDDTISLNGAGIDIYRNNYRAQLHATLADTFGHLHRWLGETKFRRAADFHIDRSPPHSWTLDAYGQDFPETLRALFPLDAEVFELAWLELAMADAFVAADADPVGLEQLAQVDWNRARLRFVPSLRLGEAATNAWAIWEALESDVSPPASAILSTAHGYIVWRRSLVSQFRVADAVQYRAISALHAGMSFSEVCEVLAAELGENGAATAAAELLRGLIDDQLIAEVID